MTTKHRHKQGEVAASTQSQARQHQPQQVGTASIGWGILGASDRAEAVMIDAIRQLPAPPGKPNEVGAWVVGIYSNNERRAHAFAKTHYLPHIFLNLADLLQRREIQCVYVGSHPRHHAPLVMAALAAGKHVLCETPLALSVDDAQAMAQAAEKRGLLLRLGHQWRADPAIQQLRLLLANQAIGDLLGGRISNTTLLTAQQQSWRLRTNGGGVLLHRTLCDIDLLAYLLQEPIVEIGAMATRGMLSETDQGEAEEELIGYVRHRNGLTIQLHDAFFIPHHPTLIEFYGTSGVLQVRHWATALYPSELWLLRNETAQPLPIAATVPEHTLLSAFVQALRTPNQVSGRASPPMLASAADGVYALSVVTAARQSIRTKLPVTVLTNHASRYNIENTDIM